MKTTPEPRPIEDPGWARVLRPMLRNLIPIYGPWKVLHEKPHDTNALIALRAMFLVLVMALLFLFLFVLTFIVPWNGTGEARWLVGVVAIVGVTGLVQIWALRRQRLGIDSPEKLAASYRAYFYIGVGAAEAPGLVALRIR